MDPNDDVEPVKPSKEKRKSRKSKESRKSSSRKSKKKSSSDSDDSNWQADDAGKSEWDPEKFDRKAGDRWKNIDEPKDAADLPSPGVEEGDKQGDEDWPYKKQYAVDGRKSKSKSKKEKGLTAPSRVKSDDEGEISREEKRSSKKEKKSKRKSSTKSSSRRSSKREEEAVEISDEEESLPDESPRQSDQTSNDFQDDISEGYDGYDDDSVNISDSDAFDSDEDGAYASDLDESIDSQGTYDSAAEGEEYGDRQPAYFETPGMVNYNKEINELMQKANPEHTDHLMNRVNRRKDNVTYDQNMPMMTRQALMTRQASAQAARNRVNADSADRTKLGFRNESFHGKNSNAQKPQRRGPGGKRPPPRSKSSGLGTMSMASRRAAAGGEEDDPRARFRGRGASTSMQRYSNKPNNVARLNSGRRGQGELDRSRSSRGEPRRGAVQRAKSATTALSRGQADGAQKPLRRQPKRTPKKEPREVSSDESGSDEGFSSDEESDSDEGPRSRPKRRAPKKPIVNPQDMSIKKHRRKLHGMMYKLKMSVDMSDLMKEVNKGEIPKSPIRSLLMDEP